MIIINNLKLLYLYLWSCAAVGAKLQEKNSPICRHLPGLRRSWIHPIHTHKHTRGWNKTETQHHRGLSEKCPQNKRRQPQIYAGERRRTDSSCVPHCAAVIFCSITHLMWEFLLSLTLCFMYPPPDWLPAGLFTGSLEMPLTGSAESDWAGYPNAYKSGFSSVPAPAETRPQPARNPPRRPLRLRGPSPVQSPQRTASTVTPRSATTPRGACKNRSENEGEEESGNFCSRVGLITKSRF